MDSVPATLFPDAVPYCCEASLAEATMAVDGEADWDVDARQVIVRKNSASAAP